MVDFIVKGDECFKKKDFLAALKMYKAASEQAPSMKAFANLAIVYIQLKEWD